MNPAFFELSNYISRNRNSPDVDYIYNLIATVSAFSDESQLWDNLFYQTVLQKSFYTKDLLIQFLVTQNLLKNTGKSMVADKAAIPILVKANVILPLELFGVIKKTFDIADSVEKPSTSPGKKLTELAKYFHSRQLSDDLQSLKEKVQKIEQQLIKEQQAIIQSELIAHSANVATLMETYRQDYDAAVRLNCPNPNDFDPTDICNVPNIPQPQIPLFHYNEEISIEFDDVKKKLDENDFYILKNLFNDDITSSEFNEVYERIDEELLLQSKSLLDNGVNSRPIAVIGDTIFELADEAFLKGDSLPFIICPAAGKSMDEGSPYSMTVNTSNGNQNLLMEKLDYWYVAQNNSISEPITTTNSSTTVGGIFIPVLFGNPDTVIPSLAVGVIKIQGVITFTNGLKKSWSCNFKHGPFRSGDTNSNCAIGFMVVFVGDGEDGNSGGAGNPDEPEQGQVAFIPSKYGYRYLGIAEYRKVVQEICCYDAGEVAHIENIMAREFKEKTTEKTTTQETTVRTSEETEKEILTDTISTQRFEMQNEIAKMMQSQNQLTAYADVHAEFTGGQTLDAGGTYASNNTKEESNRQAVTQSKELTERATERILSRIKKETVVKITESFRDLNSHIFDNRQSGEHVSGVYRFINCHLQKSNFQLRQTCHL